jgi:GNAT superfamily N-acetyltransferase
MIQFFCDESAEAVCGYYTLSSYGIEPAALPPEVAKKLPRYPLLPATMLGRLARAGAFAGRGLGEFLLLDALQRAYRGSKDIAATAVIVDAIDDEARRIYLHFDFREFPDRPAQLFLTMREIAVLFPDP